jgi:hypothetical protein
MRLLFLVAELVQKLPLIAEPDFIRGLIHELSPSGRSWECSGLQALANLAWGLALATLHMAPTHLHPAEGEKYVINVLQLMSQIIVCSTFLASACIINSKGIHSRGRRTLLPDHVQNDYI